MRIALIAPPFICVPPQHYGGTELFIAQLAEGLKENGVDIVVYTNGESTVGTERRWLYKAPQWPIDGEIYDNLKDMNHSSWAVREAMKDCDLIHLNNLPGLFYSRYTSVPFVYTIHHPHEAKLSQFYTEFPECRYVTISDFQRQFEKVPHIRTIHHGVDLTQYQLQEEKQEYFAFIGRIAPMKGAHLAIQVAQKTGIPLKIAGEVQPIFRDYFEKDIKPHIDGKFIEYIGEANLQEKNTLLGNSIAMLFPIQWNEPFGLVMIEAMACGTPVLAMPGGSVPEVVRDGVSGFICRSVDEMAKRGSNLAFNARDVRGYVEEYFSVQRMVREYVDLYTEVLSGTSEALPIKGAAGEKNTAVA